MTPEQLAKAGSEHAHQRALFAWVRKAIEYGFEAADDDRCYTDKEYADTKYGRAWGVDDLRLYHAIGNGGERHAAVASKMKAEGVVAGVLDTFIPLARRGYYGLYIEMKKPGGKKTPEQKASDEQKDFARMVRTNNYAAAFHDNWVMAKETLKWYLLQV